jgi:acetyl-CoA carboxylase carboxyl transferase subunit alpha
LDLVLEFERPVVELHKRIRQLRRLEEDNGVDLSASIEMLEAQAEQLLERIFTQLTPHQHAQLARHPQRPFMLDYVQSLCTEWTELHGDRAGYNDQALIGGTARFMGQPVMVLGHQKGRSTKENLIRNFGMARPEGYRKALRLMRLAQDFKMPIITFIDTMGAYPGVDAEERGQAEAIARNIMEMARFEVPIIAIVIGEGGSGGALAIGVANRVVMLENSIYSVISPEGCAAILWRDRGEAARAAEALKVTAASCLDLGVVDEVVEEPRGGAHRNHDLAIERVGRSLAKHLGELQQLSGPELRQHRYDRFRNMGVFRTVGQA